MKLLAVLAAAAAATIIGYLLLGEWLDNADTTWLNDGHQFDFEDGVADLPHPWSIGKDPRRGNA